MSALDRLKLLGDSADPLTRWQAEADLQIEAEQRQRGSEERERHGEHATMADAEQVQALLNEIAHLRAALAAKADSSALVEVLKAVREITTKQVPDWIVAAVRKSEAATAEKIGEKFGELLGRIAAIDPVQARAMKSEPFKFAGEKTSDDGDVVELPNPLLPRRAI